MESELISSPSYVIHQMCDLGKLFNLFEPPSFICKMGHVITPYIISLSNLCRM